MYRKENFDDQDGIFLLKERNRGTQPVLPRKNKKERKVIAGREGTNAFALPGLFVILGDLDTGNSGRSSAAWMWMVLD